LIRGALAGLGLLALVAAVLATALRLQPVEHSSATLASDSATPGAADCTGPQIRALVSSVYAPVLQAAQRHLSQGADCIRLQIAVLDGHAAARNIDGADVWIPDDAAWAGDVKGDQLAAHAVHRGTVLAVSPLYLASDQKTAARIEQAGGTWTSVARLVSSSSGLRLAVRDPHSSGEGLIGLGDLAETIWTKKGMDESALMLNRAFRHTRTINSGQPAWPRAGEVGIVAESTALKYPNEARSLTLLTGRDYTGLLRYTWFPTAAAVANQTRAAALQKLYDALHTEDADVARRAAGLRAPDLSPVGSTLPTPQPRAAPFGVLAEHHIYHVFASWYPEDRDASLLLVVDVSGSMAATAPGSTRSLIELVKAGCRATGGLLPDDASLGLWKFGANLQPGLGLDYQPLSSLTQLTPEHRRAFTSAVDQLQAQPTGTGLYDTVLAAYRFAAARYRPGIPNTIMVVTDGRQDDPNGIGLGQLQTALRAAADPKQPIEVTIAALGGATDTTALNDVVEPIAGRVAPVRTAEELGAIFVHAAAGAE
jgi:Bacterial extracellular solute-binding protein/von Willebrand factor type A domain